MFIIIGAILLFLILFIKLTRNNDYWTKKGVKQVTSLVPILGDFWHIFARRKQITELTLDLYNVYPNERYQGFYMFFSPFLMVKDPELIKSICVKNFEHFTDHRTIFQAEKEVLWNNNLFFLKGKKWKDMRALLSPSFTSSKMKFMYQTISIAGQNFAEYYLENYKNNVLEVDFNDAFARYGNDVIAKCAFGLDCNSLKNRNDEFYLMGRKITNVGFINFFKAFLIQVSPKLYELLGLSFLDKEASDFFCKLVSDTIKYREKNSISRPDMLHLLLETRKVSNDESKMALSDTEITAEALIFFFAGFDTATSAMYFMAYELAVNPDIQEKLTEEIDEVASKCKEITYETLQGMVYLDMVVSETLRKWPINPAVDRVCTKPYTFEDTETPLHLDTTCVVWLPIYALHHDPKYFPNPEKFDPERFSPENKDKIIPYSYFPFGVGPRVCIGNRFALLEMKSVIYHLLLNFQIVPVEKTPIPLSISKNSFTLKVPEMWLGLKKRNK